MSTSIDQIKTTLEKALRPVYPGARSVAGLKQLSGGASQETWSFDLETAETAIPRGWLI